jgi:hypothetical protein
LRFFERAVRGFRSGLGECQPLEQGCPTRIGVQGAQKRIGEYAGKARVALRAGAIESCERGIVFAAPGVRFGDLRRKAIGVFCLELVQASFDSCGARVNARPWRYRLAKARPGLLVDRQRLPQDCLREDPARRIRSG